MIDGSKDVEGEAANEDTPQEGARDRDAAAQTDPNNSATPDEPEEVQDPEVVIAALKDRILRNMAEMENLRRRTEKEKAEARAYGIRSFAADLLSVADNLARALSSIPVEARDALSEDTRNLILGVEMTGRELQAVFERHGITLINPQPGEKFDPHLHQAMAEIEDENCAPGHIAQIAQVGYRIGEKLLRPASVLVAKGNQAKTANAKPTPDDPGDGGEQPPGSSIDTSI